MMQTIWPAVGRFMAVWSGSGLDAVLPVLLPLPFGAAYQLHVVGTAATVSESTGAGVPAGAVGSTGGASASAAGTCRAKSDSDTMVQRRKLVIMVGGSFVRCRS